MFSQTADQPATDESPAPVGMRELPPQPARPVMPVYAAPPPPEAAPVPSADDSVIARDDHFEGTFTSRGTVVVMGSVKGRVEAVQVRIEDGAIVDADVIVDEAIVAGQFTGNLTCRKRLEAHASGRINGRVETHKLMLHEGASVEGEMHMLTDAPRSATETIRGSAPLRGESAPSDASPAAPGSRSESRPEPVPAATKPAPSVKPASAAKTTTAVAEPASAIQSSLPEAPAKVEASSARRSSVAETLRQETLRVAPRTTTSVSSYSGRTTTVSNGGSRSRGGTTTTGF